jgi:pantoate--beta-alanine ligase
MTLDIARTVRDLRTRTAAWRAAGESIALVPTMGAIHDGHLSLVRLADGLADRVVTSLFVNPLQFGPREDFHAYPRDEARDADILAKAGSDLLYAPEASEMYPDGFTTTVHIGDITEDLCGASRPNHFDGVATVVSKLLLQCAPDKAIFGEKDYQQLLVIRRFVQDLDIPVDIIGGAIVREADGLALSSRNAYLSAGEAEAARFKLEAAGFRVDYVAIRDPETLKPLHGPVKSARVLAAVHLGKTRLIDNVPVPPAG